MKKDIQDQATIADRKLGDATDDLSARLTEVSAGVAKNGAVGARGAADVSEALRSLATKVGREKFEERMTETKAIIDQTEAAIEKKMLEGQMASDARIT